VGTGTGGNGQPLHLPLWIRASEGHSIRALHYRPDLLRRRGRRGLRRARPHFQRPGRHCRNTFACPDPSNPHVFSGVSGSAAADGPAGLPGIGTTPMGVSYTIPCHHGPIISYKHGAFCSQTPPFSDSSCSGAIAPAGLGGMTYDPNSGYWLLTNENSSLPRKSAALMQFKLPPMAGSGEQFFPCTTACLPASPRAWR